jgi:hypothetical protein
MTQIFLGSARGSRIDLGVLAEMNSISVIKDNRAGWTREVRASGTLTPAGVTPALS